MTIEDNIREKKLQCEEIQGKKYYPLVKIE